MVKTTAGQAAAAKSPAVGTTAAANRHEDKPQFYRSDKRDCKVHKPCKHTWEEYSANPRNKMSYIRK
jgi:hypothetical protein